MEHFLDRETLRDKITNRMLEQGIFNVSGNSVVGSFIEGVLDPVDDLNAMGEDIQRDMFPTTAVGNALDRWGEYKGISRHSGTLPYGELRIYISNNKTASEITTDGGGIYIPSGTSVFGGPVTFSTTADVYIPLDANSITVNVVGNDVEEGAIAANELVILNIDYVEDIDNIDTSSIGDEQLLCTNPLSIESGSYVESDSDYRNRLYSYANSYHDRMISMVRSMAFSIPEVADIKFIPNTHGIGTTSVLVITKNPITNAGVIAAVKQKISNIGDDSIQVVSPEYLTVRVYNKLEVTDDVTADGIATLHEVAAIAQKNYINNLPLAGKLSLDGLEQQASGSSPQITSCTVTCLKIDGRTVTLDNQIAGWDEKFVTLDTETESAIVFT